MSGGGMKVERLTLRPDIGLDEIWFANSDDPEGAYTIRDIAERERYDILDKIAARLAAYEDTGLTPEEVAGMRRENDALMADLRGDCASCMHRDESVKSDVCQTCPQPGGAGFGNWQWRGAREDKLRACVENGKE